MKWIESKEALLILIKEPKLAVHYQRYLNATNNRNNFDSCNVTTSILEYTEWKWFNNFKE